jgi:uncharacterized CHY-type Zn-finger protein
MKYLLFALLLITSILVYIQHKELEKRKFEELKLKTAIQQLKICSGKYRKLLTYENDNFKQRVIKICPCIDK